MHHQFVTVESAQRFKSTFVKLQGEPMKLTVRESHLPTTTIDELVCILRHSCSSNAGNHWDPRAAPGGPQMAPGDCLHCGWAQSSSQHVLPQQPGSEKLPASSDATAKSGAAPGVCCHCSQAPSSSSTCWHCSQAQSISTCAPPLQPAVKDNCRCRRTLLKLGGG